MYIEGKRNLILSFNAYENHLLGRMQRNNSFGIGIYLNIWFSYCL